ncbi:MAG: ABC transporter permease [Thermodesulfovibrionales bacterium]
MLIMLKIAIRNVFRNKRRTIITELAIIFGVITIILVGGILEVTLQGLREQTIRTQLGHIQIYSKGYTSKGMSNPCKYIIKEPQLIERIMADIPQIKTVTERVEFSGIISNGEVSTNFVAIGVTPQKEALVSSGLNILHGKNVGELTHDGALVGKELAEGLGVKIGEPLTLLTNTVHGSFNAVEVIVEGIFQSGSSEYDKRALITTLKKAQTLLDLDGVTSIIVLLNKTEETNIIVRELRNRFTKAQLSVELTTWEKLATYYKQVRGMFDGIFGSVKFIIAIVVILGIANTMIMSVLERTDEIGTLMALGGDRRHVMVLFLLEALCIGLIGGIAGISLGSLVTKVVAVIGIPVPPPPGQNAGFVIRPLILSSSVIFAFILSVVSSLLSGIYPAYKASKLRPVDALRHV